MSRPVTREDVSWQLLLNRLLHGLRHRYATFIPDRALIARRK